MHPVSKVSTKQALNGIPKEYGRPHATLIDMIAKPVRQALLIARQETALLPLTRSFWIAAMAAVLKYLIHPGPPLAWDVLLFAAASAILWYGLAFLANFITKVPTALSRQIDGVQTTCSALETWNAMLNEQLNALLTERERLAPIIETLSYLKASAREIKRQSPRSMFVQQPTNRMHWSPFINRPETGEQNPVTLDKAIAWHDTLTAFQHNRQRPCPPPLDFDGTMAFLDNEEYLERTQTAQQNQNVPSFTAPAPAAYSHNEAVTT